MEIAWAKFEQVDTATAFGWLCGTAIRVQANDTRSFRRRRPTSSGWWRRPRPGP